MRAPVILYIRHNWGEHRGGLGKSISYALQHRVPISNERTSNPVNPGPLMRVPVILCIRHDWGEPQGGLGESISYALQYRVPISNELTSNLVYSGT